MKSKIPHIDFTKIKHLLTDSRSLHEADSTLFFALSGKGRSGCDYIKDLHQKGVRNFVVPNAYKTKLSGNFIHCQKPLKFLQFLAGHHRNEYKGQLIAITGSNGKTVVKEWLFKILSQHQYCYRSPKSYNSQVGVPLSLWEIPLQSKTAIIEAGISECGEMQKLADIISANIGIFTNIGNAHQENFDSLEEKINEKLLLFKQCNTIIYRKDNKLIDKAIKEKFPDKQLVSWSSEDKNAPYYITKTEKGIDLYRSSKFIKSFDFPFSDKASFENIAHCVVTALSLNIEAENIDLSQMEAISMRLEQLQGINGCSLINDAYNSDLLSLGIALDALNNLAKAKKLPPSLILSDLEQTGLEDHLLYQEIAQLLKTKQLKRLIAIGSNLENYKEKFQIDKQSFYASTEAFLKHYKNGDFKHEAILFKGARSYKFERIIRHLEEKRHRTVMEIDLAGLRENINYFRNILNPKTKIMGMVKAFGYGSGYLEIARTLQQQGVNYLAVAVADEGIDLRNHSIKLPIVVMTPEQNSFEAMIDYQLEPAIYSFSELQNFIAIAEEKKLKDYSVHIKFDTGMHRLGFVSDDIPRLLDLLKQQKALKVSSVYSHLAAADEKQWDKFTQGQIDNFNAIAKTMEKGLRYSLIKHLLNSAGTERFTSQQNDMVRLGIGMYGISAANKQLQSVVRLKTAITQLRSVDKKETIGYGRKGRLKRPSKIATLPVGYADGIRRALGNGKGYALVKGQKAPYIGNICMDLCMIDVTDIEVQEGDEVILIGEHLSPEILAKQTDTIPYEILTSISQRVKRVYVE